MEQTTLNTGMPAGRLRLEIWIFLDLLKQLFIREPRTGIDYQCDKCHAKGLCWCAKAIAELSRVVVLQFIPRNQLSQLDPAIVDIEFPATWQKEVFERELMTMLMPIHVKNPGHLLGSNQPALAHFSHRKS